MAHDLAEGLQAYLRDMTPRELMAFRRELAAALPGFLEETAEKARQAAGAKAAAGETRKRSGGSGPIARRGMERHHRLLSGRRQSGRVDPAVSKLLRPPGGCQRR